MTRLLPCPSCHRHVRVDSQSCPFCAAAVAFESEPPAPAPALGRLTRAAVFAGAALVSTAAAGCGGSPTKVENPKVENVPDASTEGGATAEADAAVPQVPDVQDHQNAMPYGAPPARDRLV
jgi:hypothetical protein